MLFPLFCLMLILFSSETLVSAWNHYPLMCSHRSHVDSWEPFAGSCAICHPVRALLPSAQWELWLPFGAHQGRGMRSVLVWAFWASWGNVLIWSHSAKPESCSVLLDLPRRETMNESVHRSAGHPGPGPPEGAGHFPGPAGCVPCAPHQAGRKGVIVRAPPKATPGPVLRLGPHSLCSVCL